MTTIITYDITDYRRYTPALYERNSSTENTA